jgi:hypothetical protein
VGTQFWELTAAAQYFAASSITRSHGMMKLANLTTKQLFVVVSIVVGALIAEFLFLEGTIGISLPSDRYSALSSLEIKDKATGLHFITRNRRFTVVDFWTAHGSRREALVLRESVFRDQEDGVEGPPDATVTVEAMNGKNVTWTFREPGERGEVVTNNLYKVVKLGCCDAPNTYTYFSLADGRKVRTNRHVELSRDELVALDSSIAR